MSKELLEKFSAVLKKNKFPSYVGVVLDDIEPDEVWGHMVIGENSTNAYGMCHGGCFFTLADTSVAFAACWNGEKYVTEQSDVHFIRTAKTGETIYSHAKVKNRSRSFCLVQCDITDSQGRLCVSGSFNCYYIDTKK